MDFFDRHVCQEIHRRYGHDHLEALREFTRSETYQLLSNRELELWHFSPSAILDLWEAERATGDPRNSVYIEAST